MLFQVGEEVDLYGRLCIDLVAANKLILDNVSISLDFELAPPEFYLMKTAGNQSQLKIVDSTLYMDLVKVNPDICVKHAALLATQKARYNYDKIDVRNFTIGQNASSFQLDNVCQGILPRLILISFVDNEAYQGSYSKNPFNFQHFNLTSFNASINGVDVAPHRLEMNFKQNTPRSHHAYYNLFNQLKVHRFDRGNQITPEAFNNGMFMLAYDLTADHDTSCNSRIESGTLRLDAKFAEPIPNAITVLVYLQYDAQLLIDGERNVYPQWF